MMNVTLRVVVMLAMVGSGRQNLVRYIIYRVDIRSDPMFEGGCFCQEVRYAVDDGAYQSVDCHCTMCRRIHAAPYVTWIVVPADKFRYLKTLPTALRSSTNGTRYFCRACGTHVACIKAEHAEVVDVAVGSIDCPEPFIPTLQIFEDTRLSWLASGHDG